MKDLRFDLGTFSGTEVTITPLSDKGREFVTQMCGINGAMIVLLNVVKTKGMDLLTFALRKGLACIY